MKITVERKSEVSTSYRSERARGLFNVTEEDGSSFRLVAEIPVEDDDWQVGVVVGPSGSGKSSIGQEVVKEGFAWWTGGRWPVDKPTIDAVRWLQRTPNGNLETTCNAATAERPVQGHHVRARWHGHH